MERGDIWHVDLHPTKGREQAKARYVVILTMRAFNQLGTPIVAPISSGGDFARMQGFAVSLTGAGTNASGVVLCHQLRALDLRARGGRFVERLPGHIVDDILAKVGAILE